jgi:enoyl-CoA hydratase/carnithine racemase
MIITLDAPGKNALSTAMMESLLEQLEKARGEPIMFIGANGAFSAGLNLKELATLEGNTLFSFLDLLEDFMSAIYLYPGPTVACVNGHAIAGGAVITVCCDHRVAIDDPKVRIGMNEVALGVRFPPRVFSIVRRRVTAVDRVVLGAELFDPRGALAVGMIDEVASNPEELARMRLDALAKHPREAYAIAKRDLRGDEEGLHPSATHANALTAMLTQWSSPVVREKINAAVRRAV